MVGCRIPANGRWRARAERVAAFFVCRTHVDEAGSRSRAYSDGARRRVSRAGAGGARARGGDDGRNAATGMALRRRALPAAGKGRGARTLGRSGRAASRGGNLRCYFLKGGGIHAVEPLIAASDADAIKQSRSLFAAKRGKYEGFEVWDR